MKPGKAHSERGAKHARYASLAIDRGAGAVVAPGVLYVMDGNTGKFACYGIAYPPGALATGVEAALEITPLDANTARTIKLDP
jgi:hypothetical protein